MNEANQLEEIEEEKNEVEANETEEDDITIVNPS